MRPNRTARIRELQMRVIIFLCLLTLWQPVIEPSMAFDREEGKSLIERLVDIRPSDREVMFIEMMFASKYRSIFFEGDDLAAMAKMVRRTGDRRFAKQFGTDAKYRSWLLDNLKEMQVYSETKRDDLENLATRMASASLDMNATLNNTSKRKLLYLIQYAAEKRPTEVVVDNPKSIRVFQLLEVLRTEYNSRG